MTNPIVFDNPRWSRVDYSFLKGRPERHNGCGACDHFRVMGFPNRACAERGVFLWAGEVFPEDGFGEPDKDGLYHSKNGTMVSMARGCSSFTLARELVENEPEKG